MKNLIQRESGEDVIVLKSQRAEYRTENNASTCDPVLAKQTILAIESIPSAAYNPNTENRALFQKAGHTDVSHIEPAIPEGFIEITERGKTSLKYVGIGREFENDFEGANTSSPDYDGLIRHLPRIPEYEDDELDPTDDELSIIEAIEAQFA